MGSRRHRWGATRWGGPAAPECATDTPADIRPSLPPLHKAFAQYTEAPVAQYPQHRTSVRAGASHRGWLLYGVYVSCVAGLALCCRQGQRQERMRRLEPIALTDGWHDGPTAGAAIGLVVGLGDVGIRIDGRSKVHGRLRDALHGCGKLHFTNRLIWPRNS